MTTLKSICSEKKPDDDSWDWLTVSFKCSGQCYKNVNFHEEHACSRHWRIYQAIDRVEMRP
jgi:hypothetical protein